MAESPWRSPLADEWDRLREYSPADLHALLLVVEADLEALGPALQQMEEEWDKARAAGEDFDHEAWRPVQGCYAGRFEHWFFPRSALRYKLDLSNKLALIYRILRHHLNHGVDEDGKVPEWEKIPRGTKAAIEEAAYQPQAARDYALALAKALLEPADHVPPQRWGVQKEWTSDKTMTDVLAKMDKIRGVGSEIRGNSTRKTFVAYCKEGVFPLEWEPYKTPSPDELANLARDLITKFNITADEIGNRKSTA